MSTLSHTHKTHTHTLSLCPSLTYASIYMRTLLGPVSLSLSLSLSAHRRMVIIVYWRKGAKEKERWPCSTVPGAAGRQSGSHRGTLTQHPLQSPRVCIRRHRAAAAPARCRRPHPPPMSWGDIGVPAPHKMCAGPERNFLFGTRLVS